MSQPKTLHIDALLVDKCVSLWRAGQLVAIPTETVYGLGADATNGEAVARIYSVKSRPQFNPLIVHVADVATAQRFVEWNDTAEKLAAAFWPGPLTLVLRKLPVASCQSPVSELVSAGGDTLAIRIPAHPVAQQLLRAFGGGIAAPSANRSGRVSPTTAQHVVEELGDVLPLIIDGGPCDVGLESTVVDVSGAQPVILRPGSVTRAMLAQALFRGRDGATQSPSPLGGEGWDEGASSSPQTSPTLTQPSPPRGEGFSGVSTLKSPGQLASHYAPTLPVRLNARDARPGEALLAFGDAVPAGATLNLSPTGNLLEAAANLFAHLRALDDPHYTAIAVMPIPMDGVGEAINDRLARAAVR